MNASHPGFVPPDYTLVRKVGSGQTSHVYLSRHPQLGEIALKLPREELHMRPILRRMFENEVQITLSLSDNNVVEALEGFPTGEQAFLALELCTGGTLDQLLLEKGKLELAKASRLILDVANGLNHSHKRQVLHRDVKPANVFLTSDGIAKLGDFGTGIFMTDSKRLEERVGTAFYMAPEIFEGKPSDVQSDVYSLGVLAYEVLSGERPFVGDSYDELMLQHMTSLPPNLRRVRRDVPEKLNRVIVQAMSRDAEQRFRNVSSFISAFTEVAAVDDPRNPKKTTGRSSRTQTDPNKTTISAKRKGKKEASKGGFFSWFRGKKKK